MLSSSVFSHWGRNPWHVFYGLSGMLRIFACSNFPVFLSQKNYWEGVSEELSVLFTPLRTILERSHFHFVNFLRWKSDWFQSLKWQAKICSKKPHCITPFSTQVFLQKNVQFFQDFKRKVDYATTGCCRKQSLLLCESVSDKFRFLSLKINEHQCS